MSGIVELCHLVKRKETTVAEVIAFLSASPIDVNQPDPFDKYPIEYIVEAGNAEVLQYFVEVLDADLDISHNIDGPYLLELCIDNASTKAYLLNPQNRIWERFSSDIGEIYVATATGDFKRIRELRAQHFENLFKRSGFSSYILNWAHNFSQQKLLEGLINYFNKLIDYYTKHGKYEYVAKLHEVFAHYWCFSKGKIKSGLKRFLFAQENYELALAADPKNEKLQSLLAISYLNIAAAEVSVLADNKIYLLENILFNLDKAKELFQQTSGENVREFNRKLAAILNQRREFMIETLQLNKQDVNQQVSQRFGLRHLKQFDVQIEKLLSDIPESQRTKSDKHSLLIARECLSVTTNSIAHLEKTINKTPVPQTLSTDAQAISREEKRSAEFEEHYAADRVSLTNALNLYRTAMNESNYSSALRFLSDYKHFLDTLYQHYLTSPELQCERISKDFEFKFKQHLEFEENIYDAMMDSVLDEAYLTDDEKADLPRSQAINIKQPSVAPAFHSHSYPVVTEFLAARYEPKFYKSFTGAVEELDNKIQQLKLSTG